MKTAFTQTTLKLNLEFKVDFLLHASVVELASDFISLRQRSKHTDLTQRNALMLDLRWEKVDILYFVGFIHLPSQNCPIFGLPSLSQGRTSAHACPYSVSLGHGH